MFFHNGMGEWEFEMYEKFKGGAIYGEAFHMVFLLLNMVMLVNLVIAVL